MVAISVFTVICLVTMVSGNSNITHICCDSTVELKTSDSSYCCGDVAFDYEKELCCGKGVVIPAEEDKKDCCLDENTNIGTAFDTSKYSCCNGALIETPAQPESEEAVFYRCCGTELYDYDDALCCNDVIHPAEEGKSCCDNKIIDAQSQICTSVLDEEAERWNDKIVDVSDNHTELCDGKPYDLETHTCCWSSVKKQTVLVEKEASLKTMKYPSTCEGPDGKIVPFNNSIKACETATGKLVDVPKDQQKEDAIYAACDGKLYNSTTHDCCSNVLIKRDEDDEGFCCGDNLLTNYTTQVCCHDDILPQNSNETLFCCDDELIDSTTHTCCDGPREISVEERCCYLGEDKEAVYNPKSEKCVGNKVKPIEPEEATKMLALDPLCR